MLLQTLQLQTSTTKRLIIPSNVSGIRKILLNKETNEIVKEIQFNKGSKLANIYNNAFEGFVGLDTINLPSSLKSIGTAAFKGCSKLTKIKIDNNADNDLSSLAIAEVPESCFEGCSLINNLKFAQDIKAPQAKAFKDCTSLNSITIGKNEKNDFTNCDWTRINESVFENTDELTIKFPQYLNSIGRRAFAKSKIKTFKLDQSKILNDDQKLKLIEDEAFYECQSLLKNNSVFTKESDFGFTSTCIELFGNRAFAYTSISFFSDYIYYINSNTALGRYYDIFFNSKKIVNFGTSVFENSFHPPYNILVGEVNNVYVTIYPNWKFNGKNVFKNTECSIWMNTVQLDGFSWTKDNYALDCFGQLNTVTSNVCLQGWNGILTWNDPNQNNSKTFDVKKFPANAKEILSKIYPPNLYKPGVNNFKYSYAKNSNIMFDWKKS